MASRGRDQPLQTLPLGATVVVIRLRSLGDAVLTTPALRILRESRPDLDVTVVLDRPLAPLLEGSPDIDQVLAVDRGRTRQAIEKIRRDRPDLCLNLHGGSSSAWMTWLSGARYRAGYAHFAKSFVYNIRIPRAQQILGLPGEAPVHTAEHHASAMFHLGADRRPIPGARLHAEPGPAERPYAVVHVAAAYETKRWQAEHFVRVAEVVRERHGLEPVILAGPGQDDLLEQFGAFETRRGVSIAALKNLLAGASLFVGNDSGPAHIAAAFEVPSAVIFGSSSSPVWGPWRTPAEVLETEWPCKPCAGDRCYAFDEPRCILSVTPDSVLAAIGRLLQKT
ncbi:MAG: lipopolysaccharide heptosyltransferase family protein [Acidobacteria bacterium]|nr:lipopolysaccharide heptosyltransferase family protein [Acidobacteriota bacterium]